MPHYAFYDPVTFVLKCHGFIDANDPGDIRVQVPEDFADAPGRAAFNATTGTFVPHQPPVRKTVDPRALIAAATTLEELKAALLA